MKKENNSLLLLAGCSVKNDSEIQQMNLDPICVPLNNEQSEILFCGGLLDKFLKNGIYTSLLPQECLTEKENGHYISPVVNDGRIVMHNEFIDARESLSVILSYIYKYAEREVRLRYADRMLNFYNEQLRMLNQSCQIYFQNVIRSQKDEIIFSFQSDLDGILESINGMYCRLKSIVNNPCLRMSQLTVVEENLEKLNKIDAYATRRLNEYQNKLFKNSIIVDEYVVSEIRNYYLIRKTSIHVRMELYKFESLLSNSYLDKDYICQTEQVFGRTIESFINDDKRLKEVLSSKFCNNKWYNPCGTYYENCNIQMLFQENAYICNNLNLMKESWSMVYELIDNVKLEKK